MPERADHPTWHALRVVVSRPTLRRYIAAYAAFSLAEWATWIAALVYAFDRGGATAAGLVAVVMLIPSALFAPFAAALGDHQPRETVAFRGMLAQALAMAVTGLAMLTDVPPVFVYAAATAATALLTITRPAHFSLLPKLSETAPELTAANATTSVVQGTAAVLSPAVAALVLAIASPGAVWVLMAAVTAVGALLILPRRVGATDVEPTKVSGSGLLRSGLDGFRVLARSREPRLVVATAGVLTVVEGALDVLIVALAIDGFSRGDAAVGLLNTALGVGALLGAFASTLLVGRRRLAPTLLLGGLVYGLGIVTAGVATIFVVAMVGIAVAGAGHSFGETSWRTLLQRVVDDSILTRVFGAIEGMQMLGLAVGALLAPLLIAAFDERTATVIVGLLVPLFLLVKGRRLLDIDNVAHVPTRSLELLSPIPMFAELGPEAIERVASELAVVEFQVDQIVVAEGDVGDLFYVIDSGEVTVTAGGSEVARLGVGDHFGEIALLRDVPRTATVTTLTDAVLRTLERDKFLEAVTGLPRAAALAHEGAQSRLDEIGRQEDEAD